MKKQLLLAVMALIATVTSAQVVSTGKTLDESGRFIPKAFTYGEHGYIVGIENNDVIDYSSYFFYYYAHPTYVIYDDDFNLVRKFSYDYTKTETVESQRRNPVVTATEERRDMECKNVSDEILEYYKYSTIQKGNQFWPTSKYDYYEYEEFGTTYPEVYYELVNGDLYSVRMTYSTSYSGEWETYETQTKQSGAFEKLYFVDYDDNSFPEDGFYLTQTLFNNDEKFEFIRYDYDDTPLVYDQSDYDKDGEVDHRKVSKGGNCVGFSIVQEDGTIVQSIKNERMNKFDVSQVYREESDCVIKINGKLYLIVDEYELKDNIRQEFEVYYRIDTKANSIKRVTAVPGMIKVHPSVAGRNEQVTVELDGNASEIQVVNAAGQTVKRIPVSEGQRQVNFNTRGLGSGVNVVRATGRDAQTSRKFIVK